MGLALFGLKKNFFRPEKKEKARPFAQRKDFLRFRVGFCSKKTGNRRKKTSSPLPRSKNRGASPIGQWQGRTARPAEKTMGLAQLLAAAKGPVGAGGSPGIPNRAYNAGPPILYPGAINNGNNYVKMAPFDPIRTV